MEQHMAFKNFKVETDPDGIALVTWWESSDESYFCQPQRFMLTSVISTLISNVNGKRWRYGTALSPFLSRPVAQPSDRRAHVG